MKHQNVVYFDCSEKVNMLENDEKWEILLCLQIGFKIAYPLYLLFVTTCTAWEPILLASSYMYGMFTLAFLWTCDCLCICCCFMLLKYAWDLKMCNWFKKCSLQLKCNFDKRNEFVHILKIKIHPFLWTGRNPVICKKGKTDSSRLLLMMNA